VLNPPHQGLPLFLSSAAPGLPEIQEVFISKKQQAISAVLDDPSVKYR
jgi:hypothetical protein